MEFLVGFTIAIIGLAIYLPFYLFAGKKGRKHLDRLENEDKPRNFLLILFMFIFPVGILFAAIMGYSWTAITVVSAVILLCLLTAVQINANSSKNRK